MFRAWLAAAAASLVAMLLSIVPASASSFGILPSGRCPSCYTKQCELVDRRPQCECNSIDETGTVTPKYYVTHVIYAPPGKSSSITYSVGEKAGTTTSSTSSFKESVGVTTSVGFTGVLDGSGLKLTSGSAWGTTNTRSTDVTVEHTSARTSSGKVDLVDHGDDEIWFLVNPKLNVRIEPNRTCSGPENVTWTFAPNQTQAGATFLYLRWLTNPNGMNGLPPETRRDLGILGITTDDFPEIAKAHPFVTFNLKPAHSGQCLGMTKDSNAIGDIATQQRCGDAAAVHQGWRLVPIGKDLVQIVSAQSDQCLAVPAGSQADGQLVIQYPCLGPSVPDQSWRLFQKGKGRVQIRASHSNKCLAVPASSTVPGQGVIQYECLGGDAGFPDQLWDLRAVSYQRPTFASLKNTARPGDSNRFEYRDRFPYVPSPSGNADPITHMFKREITNSSMSVTEKSRTTSMTMTGSVKFLDWMKVGLSQDSSWTWTDSTSFKQSDTLSTSHTIKVGQPSPGFGGSTFLNVFHDKLWKTYVFVLDTNFF
jgi:hypothetical protein